MNFPERDLARTIAKLSDPAQAPQSNTATLPALLDRYRSWAQETYGGLELIGIHGGDLRLELDRVYVPLRILRRDPFLDLEHRSRSLAQTLCTRTPGAEHPDPDAMNEEAMAEATRQITPQGVFAASGGAPVAIFGEPGAGKTTTLRKLLHHWNGCTGTPG